MQKKIENRAARFTRRGVLAASALIGLFLPALFRRKTAVAAADELVVVKGWVLRKSDLTDSSS